MGCYGNCGAEKSGGRPRCYEVLQPYLPNRQWSRGIDLSRHFTAELEYGLIDEIIPDNVEDLLEIVQKAMEKKKSVCEESV